MTKKATDFFQNSIKNQDRKRIAEHKSISTTIQQATSNCMAKLVEMNTTIGQYASLSTRHAWLTRTEALHWGKKLSKTPPESCK